MACHEVAALRLGLMNVLGIDDAVEKQHELAELGGAAEQPGPIRSLAQATDLQRLQKLFEASLAALADKVAHTGSGDPKLAYYRSLVIFTKNVELELRQKVGALTQLYRDLEEMHDFVHEIYPAD